MNGSTHVPRDLDPEDAIRRLWSGNLPLHLHLLFFFFHGPPPTELYTLSLHDALPISSRLCRGPAAVCSREHGSRCARRPRQDRKSTRLNSSHITISYAVFCLKKKTTTSRDSGAAPSARSPRSSISP